MSTISPVIKNRSYRGSSTYEVTWIEANSKQTKTFDTEAEAKEFAKTLSSPDKAGLSEDIPPEPVAPHLAITSDDVAFAAAKLQRFGKDFRTIVTEYIYAHKLLESSKIGMLDAVREYSDATLELKAVNSNLSTAIFEYVEAQRQLDGADLGEVVRYFKKAALLAARDSAASSVAPMAKSAADIASRSKPTITVPKLIELFLAMKTKSGADEEEVAVVKLRLNRFALAFTGVATGDLFFANDAWFGTLNVSESSRESLKVLVMEVGQYAQKSGFRL